MSGSLDAKALADSVDAVLFDMDGVLLDTEALYTRATKEVLGNRADDFTWDVKKTMMGCSPIEAATILIEKLELPMSAQQYLELKKPVLLSLFPQCEARPGARELVEYLSRTEVKLAVATSSDRRYFESKTERHDWFEHFEVVVCGSDPEVGAHKPAPDIFLVAAEKLGVDPAHCAIFEDSIAGIIAAQRSGAKTIVALPDARMDRSEIRGADWVLDGFEQILL